MSHDPLWTIREEAFDPAKLHHKETIFTSGNGYLSTRGTFEEGYPGDRYATLVHGVFDDIPVAFTGLVNTPSWIALGIRIAGERFSLARGEILRYARWLDLRSGLLAREVRWRSPAGWTVDLRFERFASLADPHVLCQRLAVSPVDFSGEIEVQAGLDGRQDTLGFQHWVWIDQAAGSGRAWLQARTRETEIELAMAMQVGVQGGRDLRQAGWDVENFPTLVASWRGEAGETAILEKIVCLYTSRDVEHPPKAETQSAAWSETQSAAWCETQSAAWCETQTQFGAQRGSAAWSARDKLGSLAKTRVPIPLNDSKGIGTKWEALAEANRAAWEAEWERCDVIIEGDDEVQLALRFNLFQLLIAAPRQDERVSIGAKTLSGFGYRGHVFWDTETFILPFFTFTRPEIARNLLSYRYHNLPGARRKAQENGYAGAQYPWESAGTGAEVTPTWLAHPTDRTKLVRIWTGDIEIHVSADIAYAIWQYWQATGNEAFMAERGAPVILETARFWASRAEWNAALERYEFNDVIGPDEYHDHVDNNAYTNYFTRWHLLQARQIVTWLETSDPQGARELLSGLSITSEELDRWEQIAAGIFCPYDPATGLIEQFDGYFQRQDLDLAEYAGRSLSMQVLLGIEGANRTQVLKQPDVLMLLYLLPDQFDERTVQANYDYYTPRTDYTFGSSLGPAIQAIMACKVGRAEEAYRQFLRAAHADLHDVRGNTGDGIHGASAGALWQAVVFGFAGLQLGQDGWPWADSQTAPGLSAQGWSVDPRLPAHWRRLAFKFCLRGVQHSVDIIREGDSYR